MPVAQGPVGRNMYPLNKKDRLKLEEEILDIIVDADSLKRTRDSIYKSTNFHLDSVQLGQNFKVEIQLVRGSKQTVSVIELSGTANNLADVIEGFKESAKDQHKYIVT